MPDGTPNVELTERFARLLVFDRSVCGPCMVHAEYLEKNLETVLFLIYILSRTC